MNTPSLPFNKSSLILCSYGNQHAIGGPIDAVTIIANTLTNHDCSPPVLKSRSPIAPEYASDPGDTTPDYLTGNRRDVSVIPTHKTFGYVILTEGELAEVFYHLRHNAIPHTGKRGNLKRAVALARHLASNDFNTLRRENFLGKARNSFIPDVTEISLATVDGDGEWRADVFSRGSDRAAGQTYAASKS